MATSFIGLYELEIARGAMAKAVMDNGANHNNQPLIGAAGEQRLAMRVK